MTTNTGVLVTIVEDTADATVAAAAAAGETAIRVSDLVDLAEDGGRVQITTTALDGSEVAQVYDYDSVAEDGAGTWILLQSPLQNDVAVDDAVVVLTSEGDPATDWVALVATDDADDLADPGALQPTDAPDEDPFDDSTTALGAANLIEVLIPADMRRGWVLGDDQAGALVTYVDDGRGGYEISNVPATRTTEDEVNLPQGSTSNLRGRLVNRAGVAAPLDPPVLTPAWDEPAHSLASDLDPTLGTIRGLAISPNGAWATTVTGVSASWAATIDAAGAVTLHSLPAGFRPLGGLTIVGGVAYVLGVDTTRSNRWYVYTFDPTTWAKSSEWLFANSDVTSPSLTYDETAPEKLYITWWSANASAQRVQRRTLTGTTESTASLTDSLWSASTGSRGIYLGAADVGRRYFVAHPSGVRAYSSSGGTRVAGDWATVNRQQIAGLAWDGNRFHAIDTEGTIWHFAHTTTAGLRSVTTTQIREIDGQPDLETTASPAATYTQPARHPFRVTPGSTPDVDAGEYAPTGFRVYVAGQMQADQPDRDDHVVDAPQTGGAAAPPSNGFIGYVDAGVSQSEAEDAAGPLWRHSGDGDGTSGPLSWDARRNGVPVSPIVTVAAGWSLVSGVTEQHGLHCQGRLVFQRTGAAVTVLPTGDLSNQPMGTLSDTWRPAVPIPAPSGSVGRVAHSEIQTNGQIFLAAVGGTADIETGAQISASFSYFARGA